MKKISIVMLLLLAMGICFARPYKLEKSNSIYRHSEERVKNTSYEVTDVYVCEALREAELLTGSIGNWVLVNKERVSTYTESPIYTVIFLKQKDTGAEDAAMILLTKDYMYVEYIVMLGQ